MTVKRTVHTSPVEALAALIRSLVAYEQRYQMSSADFYVRYQKGEMGDTLETMLFRYDNAPHHAEVSTRPDHKPIGARIVARFHPSIEQVVEEERTL